MRLFPAEGVFHVHFESILIGLPSVLAGLKGFHTYFPVGLQSFNSKDLSRPYW